MTSALSGVIQKLREHEKLDDSAIDEIERLLDGLRAEGWSGFIPADEALAAITKVDEIEQLREENSAARKLLAERGIYLDGESFLESLNG